MKTERILLPVDIKNCPLDVFPLVDRLASRPGAALTLLHVVTLNILAPESRIYDELLAEAQSHLARLCREYLPSVAAPVARVRFGKVVDEILAEIHENGAALVIVPTHEASFTQRLRAVWRPPFQPAMSRGVERIMREAGCDVFVAPSPIRFDCDRKGGWPRPRPNSSTRAFSRSNALWDSVPTVVSDRRFRLEFNG